MYNLRGMLHLNTKTKLEEKKGEKDNCLKLDRTTNTKGNHGIDESNPKGKRERNIFSFFYSNNNPSKMTHTNKIITSEC